MVGGCAIFQGCNLLCDVYGAYEKPGFSLSIFGVEIGKWNCFVDICRLIAECLTYAREQVTGRAWDLGAGAQLLVSFSTASIAPILTQLIFLIWAIAGISGYAEVISWKSAYFGFRNRRRILRVPSYDLCIRACIKLGISGCVNVGF